MKSLLGASTTMASHFEVAMLGGGGQVVCRILAAAGSMMTGGL